MRSALGTAAFNGMPGVTVFGIFFTPVFYAALERLRDRGGRPGTNRPATGDGADPGLPENAV
jgi:hypothetical protein